MKRQKLTVTKRTVVGKKVKKLRREGMLPANIYGKDIKSLAVQLPIKEFEKVFKEVGQTGLIDVEVEGQLRPVLIHNTQRDPLAEMYLHADFYQVNLKEKIKTMVPVELIGEAKAVTEKIGLLMQPISEIEVEALPEDLPEKIEINVENLANVDEQITVADVKVPTSVEILSDKTQVIVKVAELVSKEAEEQAAQEAAAAEAAKEETEQGEEANKEEVKEEGKETAEKPEQSDKKEEAAKEEKPEAKKE